VPQPALRPALALPFLAFKAENPDDLVRVDTTSVIATAANGCESAPEYFTVTVNPSPNLTIDPTDEPIICSGSTYNLSDVVADVVDLNDPLAGQFTFHSAPPPGNQILNPLVSPTSTTTYYVLKTTTNGGCTDFIPFDLTVQGPISITSFQFKDNQPINCEGVTTHIDIVVDNQGDGPLIYQWQVNDGNGWVNIVSGNINTPYTIQNSGARLRINSPALAIDGYEYQCIVSTVACPAVTSPTLAITINPLPEIVNPIASPTSCNGGDNGTFAFEVPAGSNFVYDFSVGTPYSGPTPALPADDLNPNTISGLAAGTYTLRLQDAITGCFIDEQFTIGEPALITFTTAVQDVSCNGGSDGSITVLAMGGTLRLIVIALMVERRKQVIFFPVWSQGLTTSRCSMMLTVSSGRNRSPLVSPRHSRWGRPMSWILPASMVKMV
jgi:hypothetical protein